MLPRTGFAAGWPSFAAGWRACIVAKPPAPMNEIRIALLSSVACLALVGWMAFRGMPSAPVAPQPGPMPAFAADDRIAEQLQELSTRLEALRAEVANQVVSRSAVPVLEPPATTTN